MNKMKKALLLALSLAMSATLFAACGKDKGNNGGSTSSSESSSEVSTPVESDSSEVESDSSEVESDSSEVESDSSDVESDSSEVESDSSDVESDSSEAESDSSEVESDSSEVESDSSEVESDSSEIGGGDSSDGGEVVVKYTFTKMDGQPMDPNTTITSVELEAGETLDLTAPTAVEGKTFKGWINRSTGEAFTGTVMPEDHLTLIANWEITPYTVTIKQDGKDDVVLTFGVESDYNDLTNPIIGIQEIGFAVAGKIPEDTKTTKYTVTGMPEDGKWALENYTLTVTAEKIDDEDLAGTIKYWDRLNKNIMNGSEQGKVKDNANNYWDGSESSVTIANQNEVTNGSDFAMKVSFSFAKLTAEEKTAADTGWEGWSTKSQQMWVGFAIPVGGVDLTEYDLTFDMKTENMNTTFTVYAASDYEGEGAVYAVDKNVTVTQADAQELGDGWYRYTVAIDTSWVVGTAADYIVLSLDNNAADVDKAQDSVAYIDNVSMQKMTYYTVTVDGVANRVKEGSVYTLVTPEKGGYEFLGWKDAEGNSVEASFTVTGDMTISPDWKKLPLQVKLGVNSIDVTQTCNAEGAFEVVEFSGKAGTYNVSATGVRVFKIVDGAMSDEAVTQLVLTEDTTVAFAVTYGEDLETTGTITVEFIYNPQINAAAVKAANSALGGDSRQLHKTYPLVASEETVAAPNGFAQATAYTAKDDWTSGAMAAAAYENSNLSAYDEVWFAIKVENGSLNVSGTSMSSNAWYYFHMVKTAESTWTIEITVNGETTTLENQSGTEATTASQWLQMPNSLATILYGTGMSSADGGYVLVYHNGEGAKFYATEILGYTKPWAPEIADSAVKVADAALGGEHASNPLTKYEGTDDTTAAPAGFTNVTRFDTTTANAMWAAGYNNTTLSAYSDVWFAIKIVNGVLTTPGKNQATNSWIYFHLTQTADSVWTVEITIDAAVYETQTNQSGTEVNNPSVWVQRPNAISTIFYGNSYSSTDGGYVLLSNTSGATMTLYATEIVGLAKA